MPKRYRRLFFAALLAVYPLVADAAGGPCAAPTSGMVARYPADGNADDAAGGNDGTLEHGATFGEGRIGQAFRLDGADDRVSAPPTAAIDPTSAGSMAAWVKPNQLPSVAAHVMEIIGKGSAGADFDLQVDGDDTVGFYIAAGTRVATTTKLTTGRWYHIAATWDSTSGLDIYVDGVHENTNPGLVARSASGQPLLIGDQPYFGPRYFNGSIDEVQIFDRALSADEVARLACSGLPYCADANRDGYIKATDALLILTAAVGIALDCPLDRCDTDGSGTILAGDALLALRVAVGEGIELLCPLPEE